MTPGPLPSGRMIVGWREWVTLPTLGIEWIKAKMDTGARTSAIDAENIREFSNGGAPHVAFAMNPHQRKLLPAIECIAPIVDERQVTSSSGHRQRRYVIEIDVQLSGQTWPIEVSLAERSNLDFRMLLGRAAIRERYIVDPAESFLAGLPLFIKNAPKGAQYNEDRTTLPKRRAVFTQTSGRGSEKSGP